MASYEEDKRWADKFLAHQAEIARSVIRIDVAPIEEDRRRNTDLVLRSVATMRNDHPIRFSARVRRYDQLRRNPSYRRQFTLRYHRPTGVETEYHKMRAGDGDYFIYGFESEPGSDRMDPWFIGNLAVLNKWISEGGQPVRIADNRDGSSSLAVFALDEMPIDFINNDHGHPIPVHQIPLKPEGRCHRWLDDSRQWCGQEPIGKWMVGPLCAYHAPRHAA